jgi:hypothetical protein
MPKYFCASPVKYTYSYKLAHSCFQRQAEVLKQKAGGKKILPVFMFEYIQ